MASCARITAKVLIVVVAAICSILGFIVVVGTIVARASIFMDYAQVSNALFWLALVIGLSMLLGATAGIYGAFKPDQCLVGLFVVMVGILSTMFIALTVAIFFIHDKYHHASPASTAPTQTLLSEISSSSIEKHQARSALDAVPVTTNTITLLLLLLALCTVVLGLLKCNNALPSNTKRATSLLTFSKQLSTITHVRAYAKTPLLLASQDSFISRM